VKYADRARRIYASLEEHIAEMMRGARPARIKRGGWMLSPSI